MWEGRKVRPTKSTHAHGSGAPTDHRPRILPELGPVVRHGLVSDLSAEPAVGEGVALVHESALRDLVALLVLVHAGLPRVGAAVLVREGRVDRAARGRDGSRAGPEERPDVVPVLAGSGLVARHAAEEVAGGGGALVDAGVGRPGHGHIDLLGGVVGRAGDVGARAAGVGLPDGRGGRGGDRGDALWRIERGD